MIDLFEKIKKSRGPLGSYSKESHGYFTFPKLEGPIGNKMIFRGKEVLQWSLNNYLGLGNMPEIIEADAEATKQYGLAYPMGSRMMSGNTKYHDELEQKLADMVHKPAGMLLNYGYQGMLSAIDALVDRKDVIVYDSESHACIIDGVRLHQGKRFVYKHNDIESLSIQLKNAQNLVKKTGGGILVITEGVFGMSGSQGKLKDIIALKKDYSFRLFVDDAHGFGIMGKNGSGTGEAQDCQDGIDIYFGTFAKAFALIGGFIASTENVIEYLKYNSRSQIFAKSLPLPLVIGGLKRLEIMQAKPELREKLWMIATTLQKKLKETGFNIGGTETQVTPLILSGAPFEAANIAMDLRENHKIFCSIVVYPVVPKDIIMFRLVPTAMHSLEDIDYTINAFKHIKEKQENNLYNKASIISVN